MGSKNRREDAAGLSPQTDDFKRIQGIGPVIEAHLHNAGILTYTQLAALSPEDIVRLVEDLPLLSVERVAHQNWPGQARILAEQFMPIEPDTEGAPAHVRQRYATFTVELLLDPISQVRRTSVVHVQDGEDDNWAGWDETRLMHFFAEYAAIHDSPATVELSFSSKDVSSGDVETGLAPEDMHEASPVTPTDKVADVPPAVSALAHVSSKQVEIHADELAPALELEIGDIQLDEVLPAQGWSGRSPVKRVCAQMHFRLAGAEATHVAAQGSLYAIHLVACNLATGQTVILAVGRDRLIPGQFDYDSAVEFELPDEGRYQLVGIVMLVEEYVVKSALGPVMRVVS